MTRYLYLLFLSFLNLLSFAQVTDNFSDGDYTANPTWTVNAPTDFTVVSSQLKSANTTSNTSFYISTTNTLSSNCTWEFWVNLQFATSGANYIDAYLISDNSNLQALNINGYFVRIGNTSDDISLYKSTAGTQSILIDGVNSIVASSSNNLIRVRVTRTSANQFTLERDMTGTGSSYFTEGSITDGSFTTSTAFGFLVKQSTATFFGKHLFDDILIAPIIPDITPPSLVSATPISATSVDVLFNESVDLTTSQTASNYTLSGGIGAPSTSTRDAVNLKLVHLTLGTSMTSGATYTLDVNAVQDLAGNAMSTSTLSFNYFIFGTPNFKDIVINEIYADPSPTVHLTNTEFVELYNRSSTPFNLNGLKLTDGSSTATLGTYTLAPGAYVVICPVADTAQFTVINVSNKIGVSSFPSLNNTSDNIYLETGSGAFIDSVNYSDTWYRNTTKKAGGWTLEQINPNLNASCLQANNWIASNDTMGGTPGKVNSIYSVTPDVTGPKVLDVRVIDSLRITICFDDVISPAQLNIASNYTISGAIGTPSLVNAEPGNMCVTLSLSTKLSNATNYTVTISGISDCNGNALSPNTGYFSYYKAKPYDVVINELMPDPDPVQNLPNEEYVELKNRTGFYINLRNWSFATSTSSKKLPDMTIAPNGYIVLTGSDTYNQFYDNFGIVVHEVASFPSLYNYGTILSLRDTNNVVISSVSYETSWYNDPTKADGGWSIEQIDANNPCGGQNNWHASLNLNGGTPGSTNSVAASNPDNTTPLIDRAVVISADTIAILFNEPLDSATLANPANYSFDNGLTAPTYIKPVSTEFKKVILKLSAPMQLGVIYHCTISNGITDCVGNPLVSGTVPFALPDSVTYNDVVINEVLADYNTGGVEFVEIYNRSHKTIDLKSLKIGSMDTVTNVLKETSAISTEGYLLFPESYLLLSENGTIVKQQYMTIDPKAFLDIPNLPSISNTDDVITLSDSNGVVIDNFIYHDKYHFPLLVSTKGVSLERIDFNRPTNDRTNWNSAAEAVGFATPGYKNSQYLQADGGSGWAISNPLFSPDNDGYNDVLNISYKMDESGKAANVFIYDSKGRLIRHLVKNEQLATEGVISWNGINDDNEKAAIGIYVIYIEAFNLSGKVNKYKLSCTLAGKLN